MKQAFFFPLILCLLLFCWDPLSGQNNALDFDGDGDYITLTPIVGLPTTQVSAFTVEMWFKSEATGTTPNDCSNGFRRLFSLGDPSNTTLFEVGECNGFLSVFWFTSLGGNLVQMTSSIRDNQWHCLSVVRSANNFDLYLDGNLTLSDPTVVGTHNISIFSIGHSLTLGGSTPTPGLDWMGEMDEIKLWNTALAAGQLTACSPCILTGAEPGLVVYYQLDQGIANGPNNSPFITQVTDATLGNNNPGLLHPNTASPDPGFAMIGSASNFVPSGAALVYPRYDNLTLIISDPILFSSPIWICDNDPIHFSLIDNNGNVPPPSGGVTVAWDYYDVTVPAWTPIPSLSGFQFVVPPTVGTTIGATDINCSAGVAFVDRMYRPMITVTNSYGTCTYTAQASGVRICCPVTQADVTVVSTPAGPLCEGDMAMFNVSLSTNLPAPDGINNVHISWCLIEGGSTTQLPQYDDMLSFIYPLSVTVTVGTDDICFKATVSNCGCPPLTGQACIKVDPKPVCGTIIGLPIPATLTQVATLPWLTYEICPGNDAAVGMVNPALFMHCNPQWQYSWGDPFSQPINWTWINLGSSNSAQNTNILPAHFTPPWPNGQTSIYYRICCQPLSTPSGCVPCYSNIVEIRLKPPVPKPTIQAIPSNTTICKGATVTLYSSNDVGTTTIWYCNGAVIGTGPIITVSKEACYWSEATDGCTTKQSDKYCLKVCTAVAKILCPEDNPCIIPNIPITLSGTESFSTCGGPLTYFWEWIDSAGAYHSETTSSITDIPAPNGTTYTLTVMDPFGCSHSTQATLKPCQP